MCHALLYVLNLEQIVLSPEKLDEWMNNVLWKRTIKIADKSQTIN